MNKSVITKSGNKVANNQLIVKNQRLVSN